MDLCMTLFCLWLITVISYFVVGLNISKIKNENFGFKAEWKTLVVFFMMVLASPLVVIILPLIILFRELLNKFLEFRIGDNYGRLLPGEDVIHAVDKTEESKINVVFVIEYDKSNTKSFYSHVKEKIQSSKVMKSPKAHSVIKKAFGYCYYLKNQISVEECIKELTLDTKNAGVDDLIRYIEENHNVPLPANNNGLWDVFIGTHSINWRPDLPNKTFYPILFRYHHSLFDGYHLITTTIGNFGDQQVIGEQKPQAETTRHGIFKRGYMCIRYFLQMCMLPWEVYVMLHEDNRSNLFKTKLENKKIFATRTDHVSRDYLKMIKEIKIKSSGASFTDIVLAALSSSYTDYFVKNSYDIPNNIVVGAPEVPTALNLLATGMQGTDASMRCKNAVYYSLRKLPVGKNLSMIDRLSSLQQQRSFFRNPYKIMADYYFTNSLFLICPEFIIKAVLNFSRSTVIVSNLPGPPKVTCFTGNPLESMMLFSISKSTTNTGMAVVIFTYDGRLHISLVTDKAIMSKKQDLTDMVYNVYKGIENLHQEIQNKTN